MKTVIVCGSSFLALAVTLAHAQAPAALPAEAPPPVVAPLPKPDAVDVQVFQLDAESLKLANEACAAQLAYQQWRKQRAVFEAQLRQKYPGFQWNFDRRAFEPVPKAVAK